MRDLLTPKQVARAVNVSESSIKRWCDRGAIPTHYTAGGHRRIPAAEFLKLVREGKYDLVRPEALGLPPTSGTSERVIERGRDRLTEALIRGDELLSRQIVMDLYLAEHSIATLCDQVLAEAFRSIGDRWACGMAEVYQERVGCEITLRILHELRSLVPTPLVTAPVSIGCAAEGDQYCLGTSMAELVLRDAQWNATSLGDNLPFATMAAAIRQHRPRLFWLSVSHILDEEHFLNGYNSLHAEFGLDVAFVVGGFALTEEVRKRMSYSAYCDSMRHLDSFAQTHRGAIEAESIE
jgi:excisionase family DNA binding protein